ncbi:MAG TPA: acyltransferase, partial [Burkholderiaceae bacterium]|nr:acyltransferase [Burkholderiaceae bacterium]
MMPTQRLPLIDALKAVACVMIVWHHLAFYGPMSDIAQPLAPRLISWLYDYGRMAVQVFLV